MARVSRTTVEDTWSNSSGDESSEEIAFHPDDLDEPCQYTFKPGDAVWIRTAGGNWHSGKVAAMSTRKGPTRQREGIFYPVIFSKNIRKYFSPLNGEIKPDDRHVRGLLEEAGWL